MRTAPMTSAEFLARPDQFDEHGNRIKEELIGGEVVQMAHTSKWHDIRNNLIGRTLSRYLEANPDLRLMALIETAFEVTEQDTFAPDVAVLSTARLHKEGRLFRGAPEIAIEVISPSDTVRHGQDQD